MNGNLGKTAMRRNRLVLAACLLVLALNFIWIPWRVPLNLPEVWSGAEMSIRMEPLHNGFLWAGPRHADDVLVQLARPDYGLLLLRTLAILMGSLGLMVLATRDELKLLAHSQGNHHCKRYDFERPRNPDEQDVPSPP